MLKAEHVITERRIFYYTYNLSCVLLKHITNKRNVFEIKKLFTTFFILIIKNSADQGDRSLIVLKGEVNRKSKRLPFLIWLGHVDFLKIRPYLICNSIGQSTDTNHLTWTCSKFTHHVTNYILLSILRVELEFRNSPCPAFPQKQLTNGLVGYNLSLIHIDTHYRLRQRHVNPGCQFINTVSLDDRLNMACPL